MASSTQVDDELEKVKAVVQLKFAELRAALHMREKLLLRQIDVIATTQQQQMGCGGTGGNATGVTSSMGDEERSDVVKFLAEQEHELLTTIRSFGRFQLGSMQLALQDVYLKQEDYITPANDHETMYKCLQSEQQDATAGAALVAHDEQPPETIVVDFSKHKSLIEHNTKHMNESIINITLQEAKELIRKAKLKRETPMPPLNLEELDDELESSIAEAVSSLGHESAAVVVVDSTTTATGNTKSSQTYVDNAAKAKSKKSRFKPKITINNCNGTINLRNISSLTINCASDEALNADRQTSQDDKQLIDRNVDRNTAEATAIVTVDSTSTGSNSTPTTTASSSNYSSNASSRSQSKKLKQSGKKSQQHNSSNKKTNRQSGTATVSSSQQPMSLSTTSSAAYSSYPDYAAVMDDDDGNAAATAVTCDFYNRLLNEIKNSLKQQQQKPKRCFSDEATANTCKSPADAASGEGSSNTGSTMATATSSTVHATSAPSAGRRLVLKNFENLKIVLEANSDEESARPVQIEQWLAEIISETDLEPMQNTDILEHSKINNTAESA